MSTSTTEVPAWLTANVRPAGSFGRADVARLRALLGALSMSASLVVLDLAAVRLRSGHAADAIDEAGWSWSGAAAACCASTRTTTHGPDSAAAGTPSSSDRGSRRPCRDRGPSPTAAG